MKFSVSCRSVQGFPRKGHLTDDGRTTGPFRIPTALDEHSQAELRKITKEDIGKRRLEIISKKECIEKIKHKNYM